MKTITIRVNNDLYQSIEELRGNESKSDFYRKLIEDYLNTQGEYNSNQGEYNKDYVSHLEEEVNNLRNQVNELTKLLNQEQSLHLQTQQQLEDRRAEEQKKEELSLWQRFINWWKK